MTTRATSIGELDDQLGLRVARRRLAGEDLHARHEVDRRIGADGVVARDRLENVEQLALVFVDALDLHVEQRVGIDALTLSVLGDLARERDLVGAARARRTAPEAPDRRRSAAKPLQRLGVVERLLADDVDDDARSGPDCTSISQRRKVMPLVLLTMRPG